jgi:hypothetical protein
MSRWSQALVSSLLVATIAQAQDVYVTDGKNGPLYSDRPLPGAREVALPPLNVAPAPPPTATPVLPPVAGDTPATREAAPPPYRNFAIVWPENEGSVLANTAVFEVRLAVDPPLRLGDGHAFAVRVNGRAVEQRFTASEFMIPPEFWGDTLPPPNQLMQLDARIVDGDGREIVSATPVRFYLRHATLRKKPRSTSLPAGR